MAPRPCRPVWPAEARGPVRSKRHGLCGREPRATRLRRSFWARALRRRVPSRLRGKNPRGENGERSCRCGNSAGRSGRAPLCSINGMVGGVSSKKDQNRSGSLQAEDKRRDRQTRPRSDEEGEDTCPHRRDAERCVRHRPPHALVSAVGRNSRKGFDKAVDRDGKMVVDHASLARLRPRFSLAGPSRLWTTRGWLTSVSVAA